MPAGSFVLLHVPLLELAEGDIHEKKPKEFCPESPLVPLHHNSRLQMGYSRARRAHLASETPSPLQPAVSFVLLHVSLLELAEGDTHETKPQELFVESSPVPLHHNSWSKNGQQPPQVGAPGLRRPQPAIARGLSRVAPRAAA